MSNQYAHGMSPGYNRGRSAFPGKETKKATTPKSTKDMMGKMNLGRSMENLLAAAQLSQKPEQATTPKSTEDMMGKRKLGSSMENLLAAVQLSQKPGRNNLH
ncbi:hypothetical protein F2P81_010762 [Scophthalmus maximus]|uniref:Uncharacterized protein n=1 Tax=Scophthalmus maximus TaxID=52904 RepID=A0A6A4T0Q3_SCOMX|nr:hypothetical protein F2P81_010762 [Scophthalmus maximus]